MTFLLKKKLRTFETIRTFAHMGLALDLILQATVQKLACPTLGLDLKELASFLLREHPTLV